MLYDAQGAFSQDTPRASHLHCSKQPMWLNPWTVLEGLEFGEEVRRAVVEWVGGILGPRQALRGSRLLAAEATATRRASRI